MEGSFVFALLFGAALVLLGWMLTMRNSSNLKGTDSSKIPPGSNGWPLLGETLSFANINPLTFVLPRVKKYGPVFKSHLACVPSIMVTTPDMAKFVYSERRTLRASYPRTIAALVGWKSLSNCEVLRHPFVKKVIHSNLLPDVLRHEVSRIESFVVDTLDAWRGRDVQTTTEMKQFTLRVSLYFIFGIPNSWAYPDANILVETYQALTKAFYAIPINLPGFTWHQAMKARKRGCDYVKMLIAKSRRDAENGKPCRSVLRALVDARNEDGSLLPDDEICDLLIGTLFGALDTTATSLTWVIKFLTDYPDVLKAVTTEQKEIMALKTPGESLTWDDTRTMKYTQQVLQEVWRYPTVLQYIARVALQDMVYKGYFIPKGWRIFVMNTAIHLNPDLHSDPHSFDPSRFKTAPKPGTYVPFGSGSHVCPGNELAKLVILVFVHHLTTKYRWESLRPDEGIDYKPFPLPKGGFPIKIDLKDVL